MLHLWHEDDRSSATQQFWTFLKSSSVNPILSNAEIKPFDGCRNLAKTAKNYAKECKYKIDDTYILFIDYVKDNSAVMQCYRETYKAVKKFSNVYLTDVLCFEYLILSFRYLDLWIKPVQGAATYYNYLYQLVQAFIQGYRNGIHWMRIPSVCTFVLKHYNVSNVMSLSNVSTEDVATLLLHEITANSNFMIKKTFFSACWTKSCCFNNPYQARNTCNLYTRQKTSAIKAQNLWNGTVAKHIITTYGQVQ